MTRPEPAAGSARASVVEFQPGFRVCGRATIRPPTLFNFPPQSSSARWLSTSTEAGAEGHESRSAWIDLVPDESWRSQPESSPQTVPPRVDDWACLDRAARLH